MNFGIPHETRLNEKRVSLTPQAAKSLVQEGHAVYVETGAGDACGFTDQHYSNVGASVVFSHEEVYGRADVLIKLLPVSKESLEFIQEGQTIIGFHHLSASSAEIYKTLLDRKINTIGMELIEEENEYRPILTIMSELAGQMAPIIAGNHLGLEFGGKGLALGSVPGVAPASVVIIGGGTVGHSAAHAFHGLGAQVHVLDTNIERLRVLRNEFNDQIITLFANQANIEKCLKFADVLVSAVLVHGGLTPQIVTRDMLRGMKDLSVFIDYSVDEGGSSETTRPTTFSDPIYKEEGVIHYCVPNITAGVNRTASIALSNAISSYLSTVGRLGVEKAVQDIPALQRGLYTLNGNNMQPMLAERFGL